MWVGKPKFVLEMAGKPPVARAALCRHPTDTDALLTAGRQAQRQLSRTSNSDFGSTHRQARFVARSSNQGLSPVLSQISVPTFSPLVAAQASRNTLVSAPARESRKAQAPLSAALTFPTRTLLLQLLSRAFPFPCARILDGEREDLLFTRSHCVVYLAKLD